MSERTKPGGKSVLRTLLDFRTPKKGGLSGLGWQGEQPKEGGKRGFVIEEKRKKVGGGNYRVTVPGISAFRDKTKRELEDGFQKYVEAGNALTRERNGVFLIFDYCAWRGRKGERKRKGGKYVVKNPPVGGVMRATIGIYRFEVAGGFCRKKETWSKLL